MFDFGLFLMQGIPESVGFIGLSLALARIPLHWGRILAIGTVMTFIIYLIRLLPVTFGLHSVAAILLYAWFIIKTTNAPATSVFMAILASSAILILIETAIFHVFLFFTRVSPVEVILNNKLYTVLGLPQSLILIILAITFARLKQPGDIAWKQWTK